MSKKSQEEQSTAVAEREATGANPLALVDQTFSKEEVGAIAKFVGVKAEDPAFRPYLAVAASLDLSPLNGEIWLIKGRRKNPETDQWEDFYRPAVGRDGFLRKAEENSAFGGLRSGTVCAKDTFEVQDDGYEVKVVHRFKSLGPDVEPTKESRYRGPVIGAWAKVFFTDGRPPLFYFAPAHEHVRTKIKDGEREFEGAWSYTSAMVEKAAQSRVLRLGFRITGVVPVDEIRDDDPRFVHNQGGETAEGPPLDADPMEGIAPILQGLDEVDAETVEHLQRALEEVNRLSPFSWAPAKVEMILKGADQGKVEGVIANVETEIKLLRDQQAEQEAAEAAEEDGVEDAIVVEEVLAEDVEPGMVVTIGEVTFEVSGVVAREGRIVLASLVEGDDSGREEERAELEPKAKVEVQRQEGETQ